MHSVITRVPIEVCFDSECIGSANTLAVRTTIARRCITAWRTVDTRHSRPARGRAHVFRCADSSGRTTCGQSNQYQNPFHFTSPFSSRKIKRTHADVERPIRSAAAHGCFVLRTSSTTRRRYSAIEIPNRLAPRRSHSIVASGNRTRVGFIMDKTYIGPISVVNRAA